MLDKTYITLSGHRRIKANERDDLKLVFRTILERLGKDYPSITLLVQLADGADQLMARVALEHTYSIEAVIPMGVEGFCASDLRDVSEFYEIIENQKVNIVELHLSENEDPTKRIVRDRYYRLANAYCLKQSSAAVVIWDGNDSENDMGTAAVVRQALQKGLPVYWIPVNRDNGVIEEDKVHTLENMYQCKIEENDLSSKSPVAYYCMRKHT